KVLSGNKRGTSSRDVDRGGTSTDTGHDKRACGIFRAGPQRTWRRSADQYSRHSCKRERIRAFIGRANREGNHDMECRRLTESALNQTCHTEGAWAGKGKRVPRGGRSRRTVGNWR